MFPFDSLVLEPSDGAYGDNSKYTKRDMQKRMVPCIIEVPCVVAKNSWREDFDYWVGAQEISKYYFEDKMDPSLEICAVERRQED